MRIQKLVQTSLFAAILLGSGVVAYAQAAVLRDPALQPGDHLRITVLSEDKDLSGDFEVAPDSTLKHPLYNQVKVAGIPLSMLKERIASFLRKFQREPRFEVEPLFKVTVGGEVRTPNIYFLPPETTVADALARAGGPTDHADLGQVNVSREGHKILLNLSGTDSTQNVPTIQSGDQINVIPRRNALSGLSGLTPLLGVTASLLSITLIILSRR
jgi:Periplasmic protein involved in polysaccharide export